MEELSEVNKDFKIGLLVIGARATSPAEQQKDGGSRKNLNT